MEAKGAYVTVTFDGNTVHFRSKKIDRDFAVSQIASVDFKPATALAEGYIHFRAAGDTYKVGKGPNAAHFRKADNDAFQELAAAVRAAMARGTAPQSASNLTVDPYADLKKLGELRDAGLLTPEEFEAKKVEVMNRL